MFQENIKEEIKNRIKVSEIISKRVQLNPKGENRFIALCPFHSEKTPSFHVHDEKGFYHCFGCGKHGDIFSFIMEYENLNFKETLNYLAKYAGISIVNKTNDKTSRIFNILECAKIYFQDRFYDKDGESVRKYLHKRGIGLNLCKEFSIGYAPLRQTKPSLIDFLNEKGYSNEEIIDSGLAKKKDNRIFGYFYNRLIIPILSRNSRVLGFGGRILDNGSPKYLNSPENEIFQKRNILFGSNNLKKKEILKRGLILSEGYMDVISLNKHGFCAVGSLGTSVSENQINELLNLSEKIFVVFDGDLAGKNATLRVFDKVLPILKLGKIIKFIFLPNNTDPEEFINQEGIKNFEKKLEQGYSVADMIWLIGLKIKIDNEPETIAKVWSLIRNKVAQVHNSSLRLAIKDELEKRINVLRSKNRGFVNNFNKSHYVNLKLPQVGLELRYKAFLLLLIYCPSLFKILTEEIKSLQFVNERYNKIKEYLLKILFNCPDIDSNELVTKLKEKGYSSYLDDFNFKNIFSRLLVNETNLNEHKCKILLEDIIFMFRNSK